jgi:hypothetical protein
MPETLSHIDLSDHDAFVDGPPERLRSNFFNGVKRLPVKVTL